MTGVVAVVCICALLASPLLFLVAGLPRITLLLGIPEDDVAGWQARVGLAVGFVALLGLLVVLLA